MRSLLARHVLKELLLVFLVSLTVMTLMIILIGVAQEAIRQGLGPTAIVRLVPYILPDALRFAVPATTLFAACSVFGRMSGANEVIALKSLGISPMVIVWPVLILAFCLSLVAVWLNDVAVSWGRRGVRRVVVESVEQIVYGMLRTQRSYSTNRFSINVRRVEGRKLISPTVLFHASGGARAITLTAREAQLRSDPEKNALKIILTDGSIEQEGDVSFYFPDRFEHSISLDDASRKGDISRGPSQTPLWQIPEETARQHKKIRELEEVLAARAAYQMIGGDFDGLTGEDWQAHRRGLAGAYHRLDRLRTEPWRRWANGFSCLFFVMVGAPLAIRLRNSDFTTSFILCFLPILIVYYPLLAMGVDRAKAGVLPPYCVWLGNAICFVVGIWLMRRVMRY